MMAQQQQQQITSVAINEIALNRHINPRVTFDEDKLKELAQSISKHGVLEPLLVRPKGNRYELVAGERRLRASRKAGLVAVPCIVREMRDAEALEIALIENMQREQLDAVEEAFGIRRLKDELGYSVSEIGKRIDKSDAHIYMALQLAALPEDVLAHLRAGRLSKMAACEIARLPSVELQREAASLLVPPDWDTEAEPATHKTARSVVAQLRARGEQSRRRLGRSTGADRAPSLNKTGKADYVKDWLYYLTRFTSQQFIEWRTIVNGRTDKATLADAVDVVMRESQKHVDLPTDSTGKRVAAV